MATLTPSPIAAPQPTTERPKVIFWKGTLIATCLFVAFLLWECGSGFYQGRHLAKGSVDHFHQELNDGQYDQIYQEADSRFRGTGGEPKIIQFLGAVHAKLGNTSSEEMTNIVVNATTNGTFIVTTYRTTFANDTAQETFTWVKNGTALKLVGYNIQSNALVVN
jgi:hypothetical protein